MHVAARQCGDAGTMSPPQIEHSGEDHPPEMKMKMKTREGDYHPAKEKGRRGRNHPGNELQGRLMKIPPFPVLTDDEER